MKNLTRLRGLTFPTLSSLRGVALALALIAANVPWQWAKADELSSSKDDNKPADVAMKFDSQWNFNLHTEFPGATGSMELGPDGSSLKIKFSFANGGSCVSAGHSVDISSPLSTIEIKATGLGGLGLTVIDSTDQTFVYQFGVPGQTEKPFDVNFTSFSQCYGGAGDKVVHFPLKALNVLVSKSTDYPSGEIDVTSIVLKLAPAAAPPPQ